MAWMDNNGTRHEGIAPADTRGGFQGRAGSIRRNTKGGSYRVPNGSRKYIASYEPAKYYSLTPSTPVPTTTPDTILSDPALMEMMREWRWRYER